MKAKTARQGCQAPRFPSIADYLAAQDPVKARTIQAVVALILAEFPELEAKISWNVPTLHRNGKYVAGLAAYKNHLTFAPWSPHVMAAFQPRLTRFVRFKNCFQIPVDWEPDRELLIAMVRARLAELA